MTNQFVMKPFHTAPLSDDLACEYKRTLMLTFSRIVRGDINGINFENTYRMCYLLVLHKHGDIVQQMLKLIVNAIVRSVPPNKFESTIRFVHNVTLYHRIFRVTHHLPSVQDLGNVAYEKRKTWAMHVLQTVVSLWREYYLRPGGLFETTRAPTWNKLARSKRNLDEEEQTQPTKRSRITHG